MLHKICLANVLLLGSLAFGAEVPNRVTDVIQTSIGPVKLTPLFHGSVMLVFHDQVIHVDPWSRADYSGLPQADLILITHTHIDHMDPAMVKSLRKSTTLVVGPAAVADTLNGCCGEIETIANGEKITLLGIGIEVVPMYNLVQGWAPGKPYHHKGVGNGYILTFGDSRIYFSGDTECTPEMKTLKGISVAFVAMNPPKTMPVGEAARCVEQFRPKIVYPYHYRGQDIRQFAELLKDSGVEVRLRKLEGEP